MKKKMTTKTVLQCWIPCICALDSEKKVFREEGISQNESSSLLPTENEPRHEKTCLPGFQPGAKQIRLYIHRR